MTSNIPSGLHATDLQIRVQRYVRQTTWLVATDKVVFAGPKEV